MVQCAPGICAWAHEASSFATPMHMKVFGRGEIGCIGGGSVVGAFATFPVCWHWPAFLKGNTSGIHSGATREVLKWEVGSKNVGKDMLNVTLIPTEYSLQHTEKWKLVKTPHSLFWVVGRIDLQPGEIVLKRKAPEDKPLTRGQDATTFRDYWLL